MAMTSYNWIEIYFSRQLQATAKKLIEREREKEREKQIEKMNGKKSTGGNSIQFGNLMNDSTSESLSRFQFK